jgi:hypothetical protein
MPALFELTPLALEIVEFAVHNDMNVAVFTGDRLVAGGKIYDTQP